MIFALLDRSKEIREEHLRAGLAVWRYADASARYVFGSTLGDPTADEILRALRKGCLEQTIVPVLTGSAFKNKGVQQLMDAVVNFLPSPLEVAAIQGVDPEHPDKTMERKASDDEPFSALAFKIVNDSFVGQLTFFRV